jgi:hypothetical protein
MNGHLSQDELLDQVYGLGGREVHLQVCADCSRRFEALLETKARLRPEDLPVTPEFLAAQRRGVQARVQRADALPARLAPALAAAFLLAIGVFLFHPRAPHTSGVTVPAAQVELVSNEQLFSDLQSMEESFEPRAAAPLHALFEGSADGSEQ